MVDLSSRDRGQRDYARRIFISMLGHSEGMPCRRRRRRQCRPRGQQRRNDAQPCPGGRGSLGEWRGEVNLETELTCGGGEMNTEVARAFLKLKILSVGRTRGLEILRVGGGGGEDEFFCGGRGLL